MARTPNDTMNGHMGSQNGENDGNTEVLQAAGQDMIDLPSADFVANADITRDGQDLILEAPDGSVVIIEGYFAAEPQPTLLSPEGQALTPQLVDSFVHHAGPVQYANASTLSDESPVGGVQELSGKATVTRTNGTTEEITIGTPIYQGDIIETDDEGAVNIVFIDETSFAVSENARLAIDEYIFDPGTESGSSNFSLLRGVFVFTSGLIGRDDPDDVTIDTPVGSIGIRGTTIMGSINPDGESQITVVEGAIVVRNATGEKTLSTQFETVSLSAYTSEMQHEGTLDSTAINDNYGSLSAVSPDSFLAAEETTTTEETATADDGTTEETTTTEETASTDDGTTEETTTDDSLESTDTSFDGTTDTFDDGSTTDDSDSTNDSTSTTSSTDDGSTSTTDDGSTSTTDDSGSTLPPLDITISRTTVDDDLDTSSHSLVAVVETTYEFSDVKYTLLDAQINGTDASADFVLYDGPDHKAAIKLTSNTDIFAAGDTLTFSVRADLPDGRTTTETYNMSVEDLINISPISITNDPGVTGVTESESGNVMDFDVNVFGHENQNVTYSIVNDSTGLFTITDTGADTATLGLSAALDYETYGNSVSVDVKVALDDDPTNFIVQTISVPLHNLDDTAPTLITSGATINEGAGTKITSSMLDASDVDTSDAGIQFHVGSLPANGTLQIWDGSTWANAAAADMFTMQDVNDGNVRYIHDGSETTADSFNFTLQDAAGNSSGSSSFNITVSPVNDAPNAGADATVSIGELDADGTAVHSVTATDPEGDTLTYSITSGDPNGAFAIDANGNITITDTTLIDYETQNSYSLAVEVNDGALTDTTTITVNITDVNEAPALNANTGATTSEGSAITITNAMLAVTDQDTTAANLTYSVTSPANGQLELTSALGIAITSFTQADLDAGNVVYVHDGSETTADSFDFTVTDDGGNTIGPNTFGITVSPVNDAPNAGADATVSIGELDADGTAVHSVTATDPEGDTLTYSITSGDPNGAFAIDANGNITITDTTLIDYETQNSYSLAVEVNDGALTDTTIITVNITDVDEAPTLDTNTGITDAMSFEEGDDTVLTTAMLSSSDVDTGNTSLIYTVTNLPLYGKLFVGGTEITAAGGTFTQQDLIDGLVIYKHDGSASSDDTAGTADDAFAFDVSDGTTTISGNSFEINIQPSSAIPLHNLANRPDDGFVINGGTGSMMGSAVAAMGDMNGDGFEDYGIISSGTNNDLLATDGGTALGGPNTTLDGAGKMSISGIGDFDGDGDLDYIVGQEDAHNLDTAAGLTGNAQIIDGSGTVITELNGGLTAGDQAGYDVAGIGDIDGDGYNDVIVGAPGTNSGDGAAYIKYGHSDATDPTETWIGGTGSGLGSAVSGAGDFNNDGLDDFMFADANGNVNIYAGNASGSPQFLGSVSVGVGGAGDNVPLFNMGDMNGDGISDIAIGDTLNNKVTLYYGGNTPDLTADVTIQASSAENTFIDGGGSVGDFNGDGFDDGVFVVRSTTDHVAEVFVMYGHAGMPSNIVLDQTFMDDPNKGFVMDYDLSFLTNADDPFDFEISSAGDVDGDGFDDLLIGTPDANNGDGEVLVVYGRNETGTVKEAYDWDSDTIPEAIANQHNDHLVGSDTGGNDWLTDYNAGTSTVYSNVSMRGGAGDDILEVHSTDPGNIDGGTGYDTLQFMAGSLSTLDFTNANDGSEALSGIEHVELMNGGQTLKLGLDDVFRLLQESSTNTLKITDSSGGSTSLVINDNDGVSESTTINSTDMTALGFSGGTDSNSDGYVEWNFGSYQLLIDQNIDSQTIA